jgi:hypothetical protein
MAKHQNEGAKIGLEIENSKPYDDLTSTNPVR